jgi:hypothetical protein
MPKKKAEWATVNEVSLVDAGANLKGRFPVAKRKKEMDLKELFEAALQSPVEGENDIVQLSEDEDKQKALVAIKRFADAAGVSDELFETEEECVARKSRDDYDASDDLDEDMAEEEEEEEEEEEAQEGEEMQEEVAKRFEEVQKQLDDANKALEAALDDKALTEWVSKSKENLTYVPGSSVEDLAAELFAVSKLNPELADAQYKRLCEVSKSMQESDALRAVGTSGGRHTPEEERVMKRAQELADTLKDPVEALKRAAIEAEKNGR